MLFPLSSDKEMAALTEVVSEMGTLMQAALPVMEEGAQVWDQSGHLIFANATTTQHYRGASIQKGDSYLNLVSLCSDQKGMPLPSNRFPVAQVIETIQPCTGIMVQVSGPETLWLRLNAYPIVTTNAGLAGILGTSHDVTSMVERGLRLEADAYYDALTGLPNRLLLPDRLQVALAHSKRTGELLAICMMDLDGFKPVNDSLGHDAGDLLLVEIGRRLQATIRSDDTAVRLGGDEFVLLINGLKSFAECELALSRILNAVALPFKVQESTVRTTASLGATIYPNDTATEDQLLRHADQAMYKAKQGGKNCFHLFDPALQSRLIANKGAIRSIEKALLKDQLMLYYQPKVDCAAGLVVGMEALIRWDHPVLGIRAPAEFLPLIENEELIIQVGNWVLETALSQLESWHRMGIDLQLSINIAARQLLRGSLANQLNELLPRFSPKVFRSLQFEILETAALEDTKTVNALINQCQSRGVSFALDDFGTGYSSLAHLKHLAADTLKIDQSFVRDMLHDPGDLAIIQGIVALAHAFQRGVIAEGVEHIEQILMMLEMGCRIMQGYGISRPMPAEKVAGWIESFTPDPRWRVASSHYPVRSDFELLLIEVSHRNWFEHVRAASTGLGYPQATPPTNYDSCNLTKWHEGVGLSLFGRLPRFRKIDLLHREAHRLGEQLLKSGTPGGDEVAKQLQAQLRSVNNELIRELRTFRSLVSSTEPKEG